MNGLVLGGGGVTGIAWELGIIDGLATAGIDLTTADIIIGTSAGAVVGAQITSGTSPSELVERQIIGYGHEIAAKLDTWTGIQMGLLALRHRRDPQEFRRRVGATALRADTVPESDRIAVISSRLPSPEWPDRDLRITAVDAFSGAPEVFTGASGVRLVDAVAASCAVPGVWPPVTIGEHRYVDGGVRSPANADLASGCDRIVVIAPITLGAGALVSVRTQVDALRKAGAQVAVVSPDKAAEAEIGDNPLDPSRRAPSARAGRTQAETVAAAVSAVWSSS